MLSLKSKKKPLSEYTLKEIKAVHLELRKSLQIKEIDIFDVAFASDAIAELIKRFEAIETRYFGLFGVKKESENDVLSFQDQRIARIIRMDVGEH